LHDLGKTDPHGYYVLLFKNTVRDKIKQLEGVEVEEYGDLVVVRVKSRNVAKKLLKRFNKYLARP